MICTRPLTTPSESVYWIDPVTGLKRASALVTLVDGEAEIRDLWNGTLSPEELQRFEQALVMTARTYCRSTLFGWVHPTLADHLVQTYPGWQRSAGRTPPAALPEGVVCVEKALEE